MRKHQLLFANTRIAIVATLGLFNLGAWSLQAQTAAFSLDSLNGDYILTEHGSLGQSSAAASSALASLGRYTFDGKGNVAGFQITRAAGISVTTTCTGSYTVDPDGNGALILTHTVPVPVVEGEDATTSTASYRFLVASARSATELRAIRTENGIAVGTTLTKVARGSSASPLKGAYVMYEDGTLGPSASLAGVGMITFDGNGGVSGNETVSTSSGSLTTSFTGSYSVDLDGVGTLTLVHSLPGPVAEGDDPPTATASYKFMVVDGGLRAIRSENGIVVSTEFAAR